VYDKHLPSIAHSYNLNDLSSS
jgi:hypothetical protein